jgi:hypothetical protein
MVGLFSQESGKDPVAVQILIPPERRYLWQRRRSRSRSLASNKKPGFPRAIFLMN